MVDTPKGFWLRKEGNLVRIRDMQHGHLRNAINMMVRNKKTESSKYRELIEEAELRGWRTDAFVEDNEFKLGGAL